MKPCDEHRDVRTNYAFAKRVRGKVVLGPPVLQWCGRCGAIVACRKDLQAAKGGGQKVREASRVKPVAAGAPDAVAPKSPPALHTAAPNPPSTVEIGDGGAAPEEDVKARRITPHEAPGEARGTPRRIPARGDQVALESFVEAP